MSIPLLFRLVPWKSQSGPRQSYHRRRAGASSLRPKLEALEDRTLPTLISWISNSSGAWETASNWSPATVPGPGDDVFINTGVTITLSTNATVRMLTFTNGTLTGAGNLTINSRFIWTAGTITGTGSTTANGGISLIGSAVTLGRTFNNNAVAVMDGPNSSLTLTNNAIFNNRAGTGVFFDIYNDQGIFGTGTFNNNDDARVRRLGSYGKATIQPVFNNRDRVIVETGILELAGGGTQTGSFFGLPGTTLKLGGNHTFQTSSLVSAPNVEFTTGTINILGTYEVTDRTDVGAGTVTFRPDATVTNIGRALTVSGGIAAINRSDKGINLGFLALSGGTLTGSSDIRTPRFVWSGGTMSGTGTTLVREFLDLDGFGMTLGRTLNNAGVARLSGSNSSLTIQTGAVFNNLADDFALFEILNNQGLFGPGTFNNEAGATFARSRFGGDNGTATVQTVFNNRGRVEVGRGTLNFSGGGSHSGGFTGTAGTTLQFGGGTQVLEVPSGLAVPNVAFTSGNVSINGSYQADASTSVSGAIVTFNQAAHIHTVGTAFTVSAGTADLSSSRADVSPTALNLLGGMLTGSDDITVGGRFTWSGGTMSGTGTTTVTGDFGEIGLDGFGMTLGRTLNSSGAGGAYLSGLNSSLTIAAGAVFNNQVNFAIGNGSGIFGTGTFNNEAAATFLVNVAGVTTIQAPFNNRGQVVGVRGYIGFSGGGSHTGTFSGQTGATFEFDGAQDFDVSSRVDGSALVFGSGTINVNGAYTVRPDGSTTVLAGAQVNFNPAASLSISESALIILSGSVNFSSGTGPFQLAAFRLTGGSLVGSDNFTISGLFTWWGGTLGGTGTTIALGGIDIAGFNHTLGRTLTNNGTATWIGANTITATGDAIFNNQTGATFDIQNNESFSEPSCLATFNNAGRFRKTAGFGTTTIGLFFNNTGTVDVQIGRVDFRCGGGLSTPARTLSPQLAGHLPGDDPQAGELAMLVEVALLTVKVGSAGDASEPILKTPVFHSASLSGAQANLASFQTPYKPDVPAQAQTQRLLANAWSEYGQVGAISDLFADEERNLFYGLDPSRENTDRTDLEVLIKV